MAIIFAENSEHGNAPALYGWDNIVGAPAINAANPMKGAYDIRVGRGGPNTDTMKISYSTGMRLLGSTTCVYVHFWYRVATLPSAGNIEDVARIGDNGSPAAFWPLLVNENAHLYVSVDGYFQLVIAQKVEIEFYVGIEGTQLVYRLWVNGTLISSGSQTKGSGATVISDVSIGNIAAAGSKFNFDAYYDDIVVNNASRIGTGLTLQTVIPTGDDSTEDDWAPEDTGTYGDDCWDHVKDIPLVAATYASSRAGSVDSNEQKELWIFADPTASGTVLAVSYMINALMPTLTGTVRTAFLRTKLGATSQETEISTLMTGTPRYYSTCRALDPAGNAWTWANVNALLAGGRRGADANAYIFRIRDAWLAVVSRDPPQDWAAII